MSRRKRHRESAPPPPEAAPPLRWPTLAVLGLLMAVTVVAYLPALEGGYIWDDDGHITTPELRSTAGLYRIWFDLGATQQYYPLLHTAFWLEYRLWGDATLGYHLVNVLLHATAAWLVYLILCRLKIPGALLAAAIFALHPVHVESVAWISEQKNTLSALFYLSAMLVYLHFDQNRRGRLYALALGLFVLGLLAKTVTATLPAALLVVFWWQRGTLSWRRDMQPLVPFFLLGALAGLGTVWVERNLIGAEGAEFQMSLVQRGLLAGRAPWFYLTKLLWPTNLIFVYPRWELSPLVWWQWLFPLATLAVLVVLVALRHRTRAPLAGWLLFVGTLFPVLGFFNVYPFLYAFVADHFQYLASLGIITMAAAGIVVGLERLMPHTRALQQAVCLLLVGTLAYLTWQQSRMYSDIVSLYQTTIDRNPTCWMAYNNLGILRADQGQHQQAVELYRNALQIRPDYPEAHSNLGVELAAAGKNEDAVAHYERAIVLRPTYFEAHNNLGSALLSLGRVSEALPQFHESLRLNPHYAEAHNNLGNALKLMGRTPEAIEHYKAALQIDPTMPEALNNLGVALFSSGRAQEAVEYFQRVLELNSKSADAHNNLGNALASAGRFTEAIPQFEQALRIKPNYPEALNNLGSALMQSGRLEEAVERYRQAVEAKPDFHQAYVHLTLAYDQLNRPKEAVATAERALELARARGRADQVRQLETWLANRRTEEDHPSQDSTTPPTGQP